jgi:hypothetical protein
MATRSRIGIQKEDGSVTSIYCHWDGYPDHNGKILLSNYTEREKVEELIALGSISSLRKNIVNTSGTHSFESPQEDVTVAYHRDRGEDLDAGRIDASLEEFEKKDNEEYGYVLTKDNVWLVTEHGRALKSVDDVLYGVDEDDDEEV